MLRDAGLDAALQSVKTRYAELGVPDVAKACGITQGLVYHYFPTKEELFREAFAERARELLAACTPSRDEAGSLPELVERGLRGYLDYVEAHELTYLNLFRSPTASEPQIIRISEDTRLAIVEHFLNVLGIADRALPATRLSLRGYFGYSESIILVWLENPSISRPTLERLLYTAIIAALRAGLANDPDSPFDAAGLALLEQTYRARLGL